MAIRSTSNISMEVSHPPPSAFIVSCLTSRLLGMFPRIVAPRIASRCLNTEPYLPVPHIISTLSEKATDKSIKGSVTPPKRESATRGSFGREPKIILAAQHAILTQLNSQKVSGSLYRPTNAEKLDSLPKDEKAGEKDKVLQAIHEYERCKNFPMKMYNSC